MTTAFKHSKMFHFQSKPCISSSQHIICHLTSESETALLGYNDHILDWSYGLLGCDNVQFRRSVPTFQGNLLPPSSGQKSELEHAGSRFFPKLALTFQTTRRHIPEHSVRNITICHETVITCTSTSHTVYQRDHARHFSVVCFMAVLYTTNMECLGVCGKIPNSSWYCLSPAFSFYLLQQKHSWQNGPNIWERVNLPMLRGRVGRTPNEKKWYHRQLPTVLFTAGTNALWLHYFFSTLSK
jgi:hypothetical protein